MTRPMIVGNVQGETGFAKSHPFILGGFAAPGQSFRVSRQELEQLEELIRKALDGA